jgi:hypothetical protein
MLLSRNAAIVNSQGLEPLERIFLNSQSPNGAKEFLPPRWGFSFLLLNASRG